jgi:hypothetical protein
MGEVLRIFRFQNGNEIKKPERQKNKVTPHLPAEIVPPIRRIKSEELELKLKR